MALIIAYGLYSKRSGSGYGGISGPENGIDAAGEIEALSEAEKARLGPFPTITKEEIKPEEKIIVPEMGEQTTEDVAVPTNVQQAAPGVSAKDRTFTIEAKAGKFNPSTIIVKTGDTVRITINAVDKEYDFVLPDYGFATQPIAKGASTFLAFQALTSGKFIFYCKLCGGVDSTAVGYVIVSP